MPNQIDYPDSLPTIQDERPSRVAGKDVRLIQMEDAQGNPAEKSIVFGQTLRDVVELYVYDELNNVVAHTNLRPGFAGMRLLTFAPTTASIGVGEDTTPDNLQVDLVSVLSQSALPPGRYSVTLNFFRDEIGQEFVDDTAAPTDRKEGGKLYIADISPSRTELRLGAVHSTDALLTDIEEFIDPSVPPFIAQALVDQTFGAALNPQVSASINLARIEGTADVFDTAAGVTGSRTINARIDHANLLGPFTSFVQASLPSIRAKVLDTLAARTGDLEIQNTEFQQLIAAGTQEALLELVRAGQLDDRIQLIDAFGQPVS